MILHGTGWPRAHSQRHAVYANAARECLGNRWRAGQGRRIGGGVEQNTICAPSDAEDGVPVTAAGGTTTSAFFVPTSSRTAWQLANSVSQLATPDTSWGVNWAWHTTSHVASTTRIAVRLLQRTRDASAATTANPWNCDERTDAHWEPKGAGLDCDARKPFKDIGRIGRLGNAERAGPPATHRRRRRPHSATPVLTIAYLRKYFAGALPHLAT